MKRSLLLIWGLSFLSGCATYDYAQKVKTISFDENVTKGRSVGPIRGEDCTWSILGYKLGGAPTIDKAFTNAQMGAGALTSAGFSSMDKVNKAKQIRYINNATSTSEGFNAVLFGKQCLVVTGLGYR